MIIKPHNKINKVSLSLATSEDVLSWSSGEVTSPETINYKSYKPERNGLFDESIFGPVTDFKCPICGTKYKKSNEGQICEKSEECKIVKPEILSKAARRTKMGHIKLASPVVHFWYLKIDHSIMAKILGLKPANSAKAHSRSAVEGIVYFKSHIIVEDGGLKSLPKNDIINIRTAAVVYRDAIKEIRENYTEGSDEYDILTADIDDLEEYAKSKLGQDYGIDFYKYNDTIAEFSDARIKTGTDAIEYLLDNIDIKAEVVQIKADIKKINDALKQPGVTGTASKIQRRAKLYKRLGILNPFIKSGQSLKSLLIYNLPVLPADLRPLVQLDGGRHSTTDVNDLYRRIIIRNKRLENWKKLDAPVLILQNEQRMLQEAVDALIDNSRKKPSPVQTKDGKRALKSIADSLSGKKGRFRQNLLGKRVDYSGRSVIVVGPTLKMHQAGIPRQMAAKLFEPWIIRELIRADIISSIKAAKKMIEEQDVRIWPFVEKAIEGKVVLLNRAPTLHRLSIQAFEPVLVRGKAIELHPLVTTAFNADFDGDQMAVHVPISDVAIREARELMLANKNILGPKDGEPIINPSQDMILGLFYLTKEAAGAKGEGNYYASYDDMYKAYDQGDIDLHARVALSIQTLEKRNIMSTSEGYIISTVGKFIFNKSFPNNFAYIFDNTVETFDHTYNKFIVPYGTDLRKFISELPLNDPFTKKDIAKIARRVFDEYRSVIAKQDLASVIAEVDRDSMGDSIVKLKGLQDYRGVALSITHCEMLSDFINKRFEEVVKTIPTTEDGTAGIIEVSHRANILEKVWFDYTNIVAASLDKLKDLGFRHSMLSGITMSIDDIKTSPIKHDLIKDADKYASQLKDQYNKGFITDDERYNLVIRRWAGVKNKVQDDLQLITKEHDGNPIFMMMKSGARGNISNFVQLAGLRGLMANAKKSKAAFVRQGISVRSTIEVPVKSSFLDGLSAYEFYSSTHGARKGLTDTALNTAKSGYLTRRLVDVAQKIIVREADCKSDHTATIVDIIDTRTKQTIVPLEERIEGRYINDPILDKKGNVLVDVHEMITPELAKKVVKSGVKSVKIRSVLGCQTENGVCKKCYGKDLATNIPVQRGEAVGIVAAQSIGEPGTQLTMRTFHTGGVAGAEDITGGFDRLRELIDATKESWENPAIIAHTEGKIQSISKEKDADGNETNRSIIKIKDQNDEINEYPAFLSSRKIRVKKNEVVRPGQKLVEGPVVLAELLEVAGPRKVQRYLIKEIQRLYRMQGIAVSDKYIEIIVREMLSKILIQDIGDSEFFAGSLVDVNEYRKVNTHLIANGKKPAYGVVQIIGVTKIPILSNSFLSAASYQETSKVLVHAALRGQEDDLKGLKENIIVGHKIPAGTSAHIDEKGKYDLRDPRSYFKAPERPVVKEETTTEASE